MPSKFSLSLSFPSPLPPISLPPFPTSSTPEEIRIDPRTYVPRLDVFTSLRPKELSEESRLADDAAGKPALKNTYKFGPFYDESS